MEEYECELCNKNFSTLSNYRQHLGTKKHQKAEKGEVEPEKFFCEVCQYETRIKRDYQTHLLSARHERKFKSKNPTPEGFCECCEFDAGCHSKLRRHQQTREHKLAFERFCRISPEKLKKLQENVLECLWNKEVFSFEAEKRLSSSRISPKKAYRDANNDIVFFSWMKSCVEYVQNIVKEKGGRCEISWTTHKYTMSKTDFFAFVLSLACSIKDKRFEFSKKEAQKGNFEFCVDEAFYLGLETSMLKHKNMAAEWSYKSLVHCESFWRWWFLEDNLKKELNECSKKLTLENGCQTKPFPDQKTLSEEKFMAFISGFSAVSTKKYDSVVLTLTFLTLLFPFVSPGASDDNCPLFYLSFINRSNKVSSSLSSAYYGLKKASPFAERVKNKVLQICEIKITD
ncbi:putative zinc finger protein [Melbournevirus]|uniref:putative zinc finger protein n=1 Tax=Melbournevirus TaxID=1560514 RepID=UPI00051F59A7|nr:putative zinc finger protein [Melbournevirus]AIT54672.1 zinc finger protein [Melbournevirus]